MTDHHVVIVGGGPTGLMLAGELALAGVDAAVVERRANQEIEGTRARGLHARTIEVLDQRGIADRFLAEGRTVQIQSFGGIPLDISDFPTRHHYGLALVQKHVERILRDWVEELNVPMYPEREVTGFTQDDSGVEIRLERGEIMRADYIAGCDGGSSVVRKAAGIGFAGSAPSVSSLIAEVSLREAPEYGIRRDHRGQHGIGPAEDRRVGVVVTEPYAGQHEQPTLHDVSAALTSVWGTDFGVYDLAWASRFTDQSRQAASYRKSRALVAGDAAHVHYPVGGQGLNLGLQDAVNLGWKLAAVVTGRSSDDLLDTYHSERHPVAARVVRTTMAATALIRGDERTDALRETLAEVLRMDEPRTYMAGMISGLDIRYDCGDGHELLGRRMPDLEVMTAEGPRRVFTLLHSARPLLLELGRSATLDTSGWRDHVLHVNAAYDGPWVVPVIGEVTAPEAVLIRPDGHVAWVGDGTSRGLRRALQTWFGPPGC